ncbi:hypothetical protein cypCar_00039323 [Cyprinus carpio]|nr:hypothetical protein cypCar_00039323 [Cyprinus carpio]
MGQALCICSRSAITFDNKRYYFIQKLDEGGFSYVDLVEGAHDGRFYALKRILCHDREGRKEAQTEVEMHRLFNHPNILSLTSHTFMERGGKCEAWLLLPYISVSGPCSAFLFQASNKSKSPVTSEMCNDNDHPFLMDLGSMNKAKIEVRGSREAMTVQDWAAQRCTISYRAPELFNVESHCIIDERTDIWSLGCVLYCMMMLEGPYDLIFQKGDSVALAVQNPVSIPQPCR